MLIFGVFFAEAAEREEVAKRAIVESLTAEFGPIDGSEDGHGIVGEMAESKAVRLALRQGGGGHEFVQMFHGVVEDYFFGGRGAKHAPASKGRGSDEIALGCALRVEFAFKAGEEVEVIGFGFAYESEIAGTEAMAEGISGGVALAGRGFWASGFLCVHAVGFGAGGID